MEKSGGQSGVAFAKTTRPAMSTAVPREVLFVRLDGAPGRKVAWISGPPGAGKTTLAASYVEARHYRCLWYQIDPDDSDPATFFFYLRHAMRKLGRELAHDLPAFTPQHAGDIAAFARRFFREFFADSTVQPGLVLDNLHSISIDSPLYVALEAGFAQVPRNCCVIVTSRAEPPVVFARMRATGDMVCVGGENLRLSADELDQIARLRGQALAPDVVARLHERTQGWAAGLVLMLEHAKISGRIAEPPGDATPQVVFDYLAGEIFDRFDAATREFLLRIACLPRMTALVAEALSGEPRAERMLLNLALNDYFVREVPAEAARVFQLHPLLREFLRNRAAQDLPAAVGNESLERAAALLRAAGQAEDAVSLLTECRDWPAIARIVREDADALLAQGRSETLRAWLNLLPRQMLEEDPKLLLADASAHLHASPRTARQLFERAFDGFLAVGDARGAALGCCGVLEATLLEFDDFTPIDRWVERLAAAMQGRASNADLGEYGAVLAPVLLLRATGQRELETWLGRDAAARGHRRDQGAVAAAGRDVALARTVFLALRGDFAAAEATIDRLLSIGEAAAADRIGQHLVGALVQLLAGANAQSLDLARAGLVLAEGEGIHGCDTWLRLIATAAALGSGDRNDARTEIQRLESGGVRLRRGDRACIHVLRSWLARLEGDAAAASREARTAVEGAVETGMLWLECLARVASARTLLATDRRAAEAQLRAAQSLAASLCSPPLDFVVRLAGAEAAAAGAGDGAAPEAALQAAFELGRLHGLRSALGWEPSAVADLCAAALRREVEIDFARELVRAGQLFPRVAPLRVRGWPWPFRIETLGRFQLLKDSAPVEFSSRGPGRPMELLKVLVALGLENVRADQLADALWPQMDADYAHKSFTATLHRLRRLLDADEALFLREGRLSLNPALFWVDVRELDQVFDEIDAGARAPDPRAVEAGRALAAEALRLYRGPFLPDEDEQPSYIACREQIRARLVRCFTRAARQWEEAGDREAAAEALHRCTEVDPYYEPPYRQLMLCYQRSGDISDALTTYERLRTLLAARLKTMPSPETQAIFARLSPRQP